MTNLDNTFAMIAYSYLIEGPSKPDPRQNLNRKWLGNPDDRDATQAFMDNLITLKEMCKMKVFI